MIPTFAVSGLCPVTNNAGGLSVVIDIWPAPAGCYGAAAPLAPPELTLSLSPDVLVIGGGIVGAASAYHLAKRGADVLLLEADQLASGATGRNLGYIWVHTRRAGPELDLVMATRTGLEDLPDELGVDFGLRTRGGLIYFTSEAQAVIMREFVERRTADGVPMQLLDGAEARELVPILPETVLGATYCPLDAQIDPRRYVRAFGLAAQRLGATIHEGTAVRAIELEGSRMTRVHTDIGPISAGHVVLAAGAWTQSLARQLGLDLPIHPMRLQVVQTEPMAPRLEHLLYGPAAVKQYSIFRELDTFTPEPFSTDLERRLGLALLESACQTADGSYLLGIAMDYPGVDWKPSLAGVALVAEGMLGALPELRGARFARTWAGVLPFTSDALPLIGRAPGHDDVIVAAGHVFGNGAGPTTGRLVADLICDGEPVLDPAPFRVDRPGLETTLEASVW
jgi:glycine/D-amino acid oxidase-like deaminating enzyme